MSDNKIKVAVYTYDKAGNLDNLSNIKRVPHNDHRLNRQYVIYEGDKYFLYEDLEGNKLIKVHPKAQQKQGFFDLVKQFFGGTKK